MTTAVMSDAQLLTALRDNQSARVALDLALTDLIAEARARGLSASYGARSMVDLLRAELKLAASDAATRVAVAEAVGPRRHLTGDELEPVFMHAAAAYRDGVITNAHVRSIAATIDSLPDEVAVACDRELERALVAVAACHDPGVAARQMRHVRAHFDARGLYDEAAVRERNRGVTLSRSADGSGLLTGDVTPRLAETLHTLFDTMAQPTAGPDGELDPRSKRQRQHDALLTLCEFALSTQGERAGSIVSNAGGCRTTVILRMNAGDLVRGPSSDRVGTPIATTGHGYAVPVDLARTWLEPEARALLVLVSTTKGIEAYSHTQRLFTEQQRLAILARDGGCTLPGCDTALAHTQAHHVTDWAITRRTSVDDAALLCRANHRLFEKAGWRTTMINGRPCWIPPAWIDPTRTPRRNDVHDLAPP